MRRMAYEFAARPSVAAFMARGRPPAGRAAKASDAIHSKKVWLALTDPVLLTEWLLPVAELEPGATFTFKTQPHPGWDGIVNCRLLEIEAHRKFSSATRGSSAT